LENKKNVKKRKKRDQNKKRKKRFFTSAKATEPIDMLFVGQTRLGHRTLY